MSNAVVSLTHFEKVLGISFEIWGTYNMGPKARKSTISIHGNVQTISDDLKSCSTVLNLFK